MGQSPRSSGRRIDLREAAIEIVRSLQGHGCRAYLAGGCVRDRLLGVTPKDYDVATDAEPETVRRLFRRSKYVGETFGVVLVDLSGARVEVATFRTEWGYADGRHPTHVAFSDAEHDAQRRDFTVNGMFEDPITGKVIDYVSGRSDLANGVIRAIGEPDARFGEDYLRMLRAARFAAALGFKLEKRTAAAMRKHAGKLADVSRERTGLEVQSMLTGPRPALAAGLMQRTHLDAPVLDEDHKTVALTTMRRLQSNAAYPTMLAAWALDRHIMPRLTGHPSGGNSVMAAERLSMYIGHLIEKEMAELIKRWRRALCMSNEHRDAMRSCLKFLPQVLSWRSLSVARRKRLLAQSAWFGAFSLLKALRRPEIPFVLRTVERDAKRLWAEGTTPPPLLTGDDLIQTGLKPGPAFRRLLDQAYDAQLEGKVQTRDEAIRWIMRSP